MKFMYKIIFLVNKVLINLVPKKELSWTLRKKNRSWYGSMVNKYISIEDYMKKYDKNYENYFIDDGAMKIYKLNDFYITNFNCHTYIHDNKNNVLKESTNYKGNIIDELIDVKEKNIIEVDEIFDAALNFNFNYWHFTFEALPKIMSLETSGYKGLYLIHPKSYIDELMNLIGIPTERRVYLKEGITYKAKTVYLSESIQQFTIRSIKPLMNARNKILDCIDFSDLDNYPKKLFVNRIGTRQIINSSDIQAVLEKYGFTTIIPEDYSLTEQIKYFRAADVVFTPHGANCANAIYMKEGAHFIETFANNFIFTYLLYYIKELGIRYHILPEFVRPALQFEGDTCDKNLKIEDKNVDYSLDPRFVESIVCNL